MHKALYPDDDSCSESPGLSGREKREYLQEIERIRSELAGFQPIAKPLIKDDQGSIESDCEELGTADEYFWTIVTLHLWLKCSLQPVVILVSMDQYRRGFASISLEVFLI